MLKNYFFAFLMLCSTAAFAQKGKYNGAVYRFNFGYRAIDFKPFDTYLKESGAYTFGRDNDVIGDSLGKYPALKSSMLTASFNADYITNNIMFGFDLNVSKGGKVSSGSSTPDNASVDIIPFAAGAMVNVGYAFVTKGFLFYPQVGIGYNSTAIWMQSEKDKYWPVLGGVPGSDAFLANPFADIGGQLEKENLVYTKSNMMLNFAVGGDYFVATGKNGSPKGFAIGLKVGYRAGIAERKMRVNMKTMEQAYTMDSNGDLANRSQPSFTSGGFYATISIGGGSLTGGR